MGSELPPAVSGTATGGPDPGIVSGRLVGAPWQSGETTADNLYFIRSATMLLQQWGEPTQPAVKLLALLNQRYRSQYDVYGTQGFTAGVFTPFATFWTWNLSFCMSMPCTTFQSQNLPFCILCAAFYSWNFPFRVLFAAFWSWNLHFACQLQIWELVEPCVLLVSWICAYTGNILELEVSIWHAICKLSLVVGGCWWLVAVC